MPLAVQPPVVVAERTDAWLAAPALTAHATAWLTVPRGAGGPDLVVRRGGNTLVVRSGGKTRTIFDGGCVAGDDCDDARAPVASAADGFAYGVAAGAGATYVAYVDLAGTTTVLHGNERAGADTRLVVGADGASVAWSEGATIRARAFATAPSAGRGAPAAWAAT